MSEHAQVELDRIIAQEEKHRQQYFAMAAERGGLRFPTPQEITDALEALQAGTEAVSNVAWWIRAAGATLDSDARPEIDAPTLELIGRLYVYAHDARGKLAEAGGYVDEVEKSLIMVEELREQQSRRS
jgi:hypothetical protein